MHGRLHHPFPPLAHSHPQTGVDAGAGTAAAAVPALALASVGELAALEQDEATLAALQTLPSMEAAIAAEPSAVYSAPVIGLLQQMGRWRGAASQLGVARDRALHGIASLNAGSWLVDEAIDVGIKVVAAIAPTSFLTSHTNCTASGGPSPAVYIVSPSEADFFLREKTARVSTAARWVAAVVQNSSHYVLLTFDRITGHAVEINSMDTVGSDTCYSLAMLLHTHMSLRTHVLSYSARSVQQQADGSSCGVHAILNLWRGVTHRWEALTMDPTCIARARLWLQATALHQYLRSVSVAPIHIADDEMVGAGDGVAGAGSAATRADDDV